MGSMLPRSEIAKNRQAAYWLTGLYYWRAASMDFYVIEAIYCFYLIYVDFYFDAVNISIA